MRLKANLCLSFLLSCLSMGVACSPEPPGREAVISESPRSTPDSVESIWHSNEAVIQTALEGGPIFEDRYMEACKFFEELTSIQIRGEGTFVGWLPNEHTKEDLQAVRDWYSANQHRLYWDEETKAIKVR